MVFHFLLWKDNKIHRGVSMKGVKYVNTNIVFFFHQIIAVSRVVAAFFFFFLQLRHDTKCFNFNCFPVKKGPYCEQKSCWNSSKLEEACSCRQNAKSASQDNIQVSWRAKPKCIHLIWITCMLTCSISLHRHIRYLWIFHTIDCGGQEGKT